MDNQFILLYFIQNLIHNFVFIDRKPNLLSFDLSSNPNHKSRILNKKNSEEFSNLGLQMPKSQSYFQLKNEQKDIDNKKMQSISKMTVHHSSAYDYFSKMKQNQTISNKQNQKETKKQQQQNSSFKNFNQNKQNTSLQIKDLLMDMEQEFPSSGIKNRTDLFKEIFISYVNQKNFTYTQEQAAKITIKFLNKQNEMSLILRNALDLFLKTDESKEDQIYSLISQICIESETIFESLPSVACLKAELSMQSHDLLSNTLIKTLGHHRIMKNNYNERESKHWMKRIPSYLISAKRNCPNGSSLSSTSDLSFQSDNKSLSAIVIVRRKMRTRSISQLNQINGSDSI